MNDEAWFKWCFLWWTPYVCFSVDTERAKVDVGHIVPPKGWVS